MSYVQVSNSLQIVLDIIYLNYDLFTKVCFNPFPYSGECNTKHERMKHKHVRTFTLLD